MRRGEAEDVAAPAGPGVGEHFECGGLPGPGRRDDQLDPPSIGGQGADHHRLTGVQVVAVGGGFDESKIDRDGVEGVPVRPIRSAEEWAAPDFPDNGIAVDLCCFLDVQVLGADFVWGLVAEC